MGWDGSHRVIGQKNIVAYVNSSNTHRGHSHSLTQPTGDTVPGNAHSQEMPSKSSHTPRKHFQSQPHLQKLLSGQHTPMVEMIQPIHSHRIIVKANTYCERHCHSNTHPLETLSQPTHHLGYTSSELLVNSRCPRDLTLAGSCVAITFATHLPAQPIGDTLLGDMHTPQSELSQMLNKLPLTYDAQTITPHP